MTLVPHLGSVIRLPWVCSWLSLRQTCSFRFHILGFNFLQCCGYTTSSIVSRMASPQCTHFGWTYFGFLHSLVWCFPAHLTHPGSLLQYRCVCQYAWHCLHCGISLDFPRGWISTLLPRILVISYILFVFSSALNVRINISRGSLLLHLSIFATSITLYPVALRSLTILPGLHEWCRFLAITLIGVICLSS